MTLNYAKREVNLGSSVFPFICQDEREPLVTRLGPPKNVKAASSDLDEKARTIIRRLETMKKHLPMLKILSLLFCEVCVGITYFGWLESCILGTAN